MGLLSGLWNAATWVWNQLQNVAPGFTNAVTNTVTNIVDTVVNAVQNTGSQSNPPAQPRPPTTPAGPTPEEICQRQINRRASRFDRDIGRKARPAIDGDTRFYNELTPDIAADFWGRTNPADLILAAASNPVIYGIVEMMKHERQTLAAFMQHPVRSTADTLRLLFADAVHYEHFTAEAVAFLEQSNISVLLQQEQGGEEDPYFYVNYNLQEGETIESIALRMGMSVDELMAGYDLETGTIQISLPGWVWDNDYPILYHSTGRTLNPEDGHTYIDRKSRFIPPGFEFYKDVGAAREWWDSLTPTEQHIEMALHATYIRDPANAPGFDHISEHSFDFVDAYIRGGQNRIEEIANDFGVDPALVAGIIASELLYDYDWQDQLIDSVGILDRVWDSRDYARGYANVHRFTFEQSEKALQDIVPFDAYEGSLSDPESTEGVFANAALVARYLQDLYVGNLDTFPDLPAGNVAVQRLEELTAEDYAIIFAAYRSGVGGYTAPEGFAGFETLFQFQECIGTDGSPCKRAGGWLSNNAQLAFPVMEYMMEVFGNER